MQVVEVGFTQDTRFEEKMLEKQAQHAGLVQLLRDAGWTVQYHVILIGVAGSVYKPGLQALRDMGMADRDARRLLTELHMHAVTSLRDILLVRRTVERAQRAGVG